MTNTLIMSRRCVQDASGAKQATKDGPVNLAEKANRRIVDLLALPGVEDVELEVPTRLRGETAQAADLS